MKRILITLTIALAINFASHAQYDDSYSTSFSTSSSNGKTITTTSTSRRGDNKKRVESPKDLNVFPLFGDRYKRNKNCKLTVIDSEFSKYRGLEVNGDKAIVDEILRLVEKDAENASNVTRTYSDSKDEIVMTFGTISVGFTGTYNGSSCNVFISYW